MIITMAGLRIRLYGPPPEELGRLTGREVPDWATRLYGLFGETPQQVSAGAAVSALAGALEHRLKKLSQLFGLMERHGWVLELEGDHVLCRHPGISELDAQAQLERLGVWMLVRAHAPHEERSGAVIWESGQRIG
jgi:hypothetical protein